MEETKNQTELESLREELEALKKRDSENQEKIKMLVEIADKGRLYKYESAKAGANRKPMFVKLARYEGGYIVGWRTLKDELIKDARTGRVVGENQEFEVLVLKDNDKIVKEKLDGYVNFSNARYNERVECEVVGRKEEYDGRISFDLKLPDGRTYSLDSRFVN